MEYLIKVDFLICLKTLSTSCDCLRSSAASNKFSSRIVLNLAPSIFSSTLTSFPVPGEENHPHSMMLPPPCLTIYSIFHVDQNAHIFFHTFLETCLLVQVDRHVLVGSQFSKTHSGGLY
ncbi:hypothetical protein ILYODFUR_036093 [Ilyodon furcidens]|uniref:Uncharacterized protein n=1 Tax=Ilyodon furcidens TaxID=33524 RepID=A0ABV0UNF3_9TELE